MVPLMVVIAVANIHVMLLFIRRKELRSKRNAFLITLCPSDTAVWLLGIPLMTMVLQMVDNKSIVHLFNKLPQLNKFFYLSDIFILLTGFSTIFNLSAVIWDRTFLLLHPFFHRNFMTKSKVVALITGIWLLSLILSVIPIAWRYRYFADINYWEIICDYLINVVKSGFSGKKLDNQFGIDNESIEKRYGIGIACISIILVLVDGICFVKIFCLVRKRRPCEQRKDDNSLRSKREMKASVILLFMFVFLSAWMASSVYFHVDTTAYTDNLMSDESLTAHTEMMPEMKTIMSETKTKYGVLGGRFLVSFFNPFLYIMYKADFLRVIKEDWRRTCSVISYLCRRWGICERCVNFGRQNRQGRRQYNVVHKDGEDAGVTNTSTVRETSI